MKKFTLIFLLLSLQSHSQELGVSLFATDFWFPTEIVHANDDRLFVLEKAGKIKIVQPDGTVNPTPFLQLPPEMLNTAVEGGLLGLAFHPNYSENGFFYIYYSRADAVATVSRFSVSEDPDIANPDSEFIILEMPHEFSAHYGGTIKFGPDNLLYIATGDGGGADIGVRSQDINDNLGKILRLDIDAPAPYIPAGNPFVNADGNDEVWAIGFRNPWKFSFDRLTGDMLISDVGESQIEEINKIEAPLTAGLNFGWRCYEGTMVYNTTNCDPMENMVMPFAEYDHSVGCAIIGGYVYRGTQYPAIAGKYIFSDFCLHRIAMMDAEGNITYSETIDEPYFFTTFGEDQNGELYVTGGHNMYKVTSTPLASSEFAVPQFTISPNPAHAEFSVSGEFENDLLTVQLFDLSGKLLKEEIVENDQQIDIAHLSAGFYAVHIEDGAGRKSVVKLLKT